MRTALFVTFQNDALFPATGQATVKLLRRLGVELGFPTTQSCCGQMHYNTGYRTETAKLVRHFVEVFGAYDRIIVPSASCGGLPSEAYAAAAESVGDDDLLAEVGAITPRVYEVTRFLTDILDVEGMGAYFPHRVTHHPTCVPRSSASGPTGCYGRYWASTSSSYPRRRSAAASAAPSRSRTAPSSVP
ncbi:Lactate utilization protein A [Streptomyces sp. RB17]|nr:Lactate utilization protein A [Streptomyces sp. RB17]